MLRCALTLVLFTSCVSAAKQVVAPEPEGGGALSCKDIVEQCDAQCSDPLCLHRCTPQGTDEARSQHDALLDCGQRNGCTAQDCMEQNCTAEIQTCMGPDGAPPATAPATEPVSAPADAAPGQGT